MVTVQWNQFGKAIGFVFIFKISYSRNEIVSFSCCRPYPPPSLICKACDNDEKIRYTHKAHGSQIHTYFWMFVYTKKKVENLLLIIQNQRIIYKRNHQSGKIIFRTFFYYDFLSCQSWIQKSNTITQSFFYRFKENNRWNIRWKFSFLLLFLFFASSSFYPFCFFGICLKIPMLYTHKPVGVLSVSINISSM